MKEKSTYLIVFLFLISLASAWPYQLNLTNGTLTDLNSSNNITNFTILIVTQNVTNITSIINITNLTCYNCSINNITNYNITNNITYNGINVTEAEFNSILDTKLNISDFNTFKSTLNFPTRTEFDTLADKVRSINITTFEETPHGVLYGLSILGILFGFIAIFFAFNRSGGD